MWQVFLSLSIVFTSMGIAYIVIAKNRANLRISIVNFLMITIFIADTLIFIPMYYVFFGSEEGFSLFFKTVFVSLHNAIRLFIVDCDFEMVKDMVPHADNFLYYAYTCYAAILFLLSPILTFSFIFSFFRNLSAHRKYIANYSKDVYVFSEVNEKTIALASSIKDKFNTSTIVFTNLSKNDEIRYEQCKKIGAIVFEKDIQALNFMFHSKKKSINFLLFGDDEALNIQQGIAIINKYNKRKNTNVYVLSDEIEGEVSLNAVPSGEIKLRRIGSIRTMIYSVMQDKGKELFDGAIVDKDKKYRDISAVIVGLGKYGSEITKTLAWFCQMDGYKVEIDAFDINTDAESIFSDTCPELMDEKYNNHFEDKGESQYKICIHSGINVNTVQFQNAIKKFNKATYVFVALGDDELNIRTSLKLRMLFEKMEIKPKIQAVVENSNRKKALQDIKNYSGQPYDIEYIGSADDIYSYNNIFNSELQQEALMRHLKWGEEEDFWKYEYNYRSSMASVLHKRMKIHCSIPGIEKDPSDRDEKELWNLRYLEHRRWNAYMRSEGYVYAPQRNNLAKTHHCLVTFDMLSQKDKEKDDD